jgi:PTH1 family peptidyl-tRNA hydrolase
MKLIVGLGNPGPEYARSRHNVGFMVLDRFAERNAIRFNQKRAHSQLGRGTVDDVEVLLAKPQTYMNLSGRAVQGLLAKNGIKPTDLLVVYDDFDLPLGTLRLRQRGSAGTHNGMRSIVTSIGTQDFARMRVGIGTAQGVAVRDFVLGNFDSESLEVFEQTRERAVEAIETFLTSGLTIAMNQFNA